LFYCQVLFWFLLPPQLLPPAVPDPAVPPGPEHLLLLLLSLCCPPPERIISLSIKKLAEKAVTWSINCTLAAPGCQRLNMIHSGSPRLSETEYNTLWQPQAVEGGKISPLIALSYQRVKKGYNAL